MNECCAICRHRYDLKKSDYSNGGCVDTNMPGYICMAFADENVALWMVGQDEETGICEAYEKRKQS